jgi:hypothetical protein
MAADPACAEQLEAMRLTACLELLENPDISDGVRTSCRAVMEGPELARQEDFGYPAAIAIAAACCAAAWFGRAYVQS